MGILLWGITIHNLDTRNFHGVFSLFAFLLGVTHFLLIQKYLGSTFDRPYIQVDSCV